MPRKFRLDEYFTRLAAASGASGYLHYCLSEPLGRTKVSTEEPLVRIEHDHQCDVREIMPLGHHLRANQNPSLTGRHSAYDFFHVAASADDVPIETCECYTRKKASESLFNALGALSDGLHRKPTLRASRGQ